MPVVVVLHIAVTLSGGIALIVTPRKGGDRQRDDRAAVSRGIRRATRCKLSVPEKTRIVLEGRAGQNRVAELCRKEGIAQNLYYRPLTARKTGLIFSSAPIPCE